MDLNNLQKSWDAFAENDALWAVLTWAGKENKRWDPGEFFEIGRGEVNYVVKEAEKRHASFERLRALDFGCGVGRLTIPLCDHFAEVHGVDISSKMLAHAEHFKSSFEKTDCFFHQNSRNDLSLFQSDSFDFILSLIVLQHMEPPFALSYIKEFIRILKGGGMCIFQLPDQTENKANYSDFDKASAPVMEMYGLSPERVITEIESSGGSVLEVSEDESCGPELRSFRYFITK